MDRNLASMFRVYRREVEQTHATGQATKHSYRPALQVLVEGFAGDGSRALNEPAHVACGAPDFIVERRGVPAGHIECKDIGANLDHVQANEQLVRYRASLPNLILTDYLEFRWYAQGELREVARLGRIDGQGRIAADKKGVERVSLLLNTFLTADQPSISNPRELAERMAAKARLLRDGIGRILRQEDEAGPLHELLAAYRDVLITSLSPGQFADLQAQTAAYGLFAARCLHDDVSAGTFTRQSAVFADTTPFLRDLFGRIAGPGIDPRIAWIVDDLALLLDQADMASVLADFGKRARKEDPVVHFYEDFLVAYDQKLREIRGVYYTPEPVVSYIVRSVDRLLRTHFSLADGLADIATVAVETQDGTTESSPRVLILDPAAGTGTFLREAIACIRATIEGKGLAGAWSDYVGDHLLSRLFGFELLIAPYAICHLKLALEIGGTEAGFKIPAGQRLGIFLTNTLEEAHEGAAGALFAHEIAREAAGADAVKREKPVMVVLGNPPYSGHSANKGKWIRELLRGRDGAGVTGSYFDVDGQPLGEKNPKWLNDDYVKFIRFAQWRIEQTGEGVLGFVTNHSYLDNPTFRGMRQSLMETFDEIYLLDLHGNAKKKETAPDGSRDENVFDIQQGVAIGLFIKRADASEAPARVLHADLWGEREVGPDGGKYGWLAANDVKTTEWAELSPKAPLYLFVPRDEARMEEYEAGWKLTDIFPVNSVGIVTARDKLAIQYTTDDMRRVVSDFAKLPEETARSRYSLGKDVRDWKVLWAQEDLRSNTNTDTRIVPILYRPFDIRFTYYTGKSRGFICMPRPSVMHHMLAGPNLGLISCRQQSQVGIEWGYCGVARSIIESCAISNKTREINYLFPLYTYAKDTSDTLGEARHANLDQEFIKAVTSTFDLIPDGTDELETTFGPEDVFHYIYAVLHSPEYRHRYADFLKSDFPRIPLTSNQVLFAALASLGQRLVALHLMEVDASGAPAFPHAGSNRVDKVRYVPPAGTSGRVCINQDQYFEGVEPETWSFTIGGYQPAQKWLKDRKNRVLSFNDIAHYCRICTVLAETPEVMAHIDETINAHGGWPLA